MILWNSKESTPDLEDSSVIIDDVFYGSHNVVVDLSELGALDPARQAKYGVTNWTDLTVAQLEAEIPTFKSVMSVNYDTTGSSDVEIENRGKNLSQLLPPRYLNGTSIIADDNWESNGVSKAWIIGIFPVKAGTYYTKVNVSNYNCSSSGSRLSYSLLTKDRERISYLNHFSPILTSDGVLEGTFTISDTLGADYIFVHVYHYKQDGFFTLSNAQIEEGSEATEYEDPLEEKITISSPQGLHGVDGISDELNKDGTKTKRWTDVVDLSTLTTSDVSLISTNSSKSHIELEIDEDTHGLAKTDAWHNMLFDYLGYYYPDGFRDKAVSWDSTLTAPELTEEEE